jgi:hypothetical protein
MDTVVPTIKPKSNFEESLGQLDLQGVLMLLTILSEKALYLQSKELMDKKQVLKPKTIIHG